MILRLAALVAFIIGAVVCLVDDTPDAQHITAILFAGLACWAGSTLAGDRL